MLRETTLARCGDPVNIGGKPVEACREVTPQGEVKGGDEFVRIELGLYSSRRVANVPRK